SNKHAYDDQATMKDRRWISEQYLPLLSGEQTMTQILNPADLKQIAADLALAEQKAAAAKRLQAEQAEAGVRQAFEAREVAPEAPERIKKVIKDAAEQGKHEVLVLRFPSTFCKDGGRCINNFE